MLLDLLHDTLFDLAIRDHVFVMICAPSTEPVNKRLPLELRCKMLPEAAFKLLYIEESVLLTVNVLD